MPLPVSPSTQIHKMTWVFWITLPILLSSMLLAIVLGTQDPNTRKFDFSWEEIFQSDSFPAMVISAIVLLLLNRIKLTWEFNETGFTYRYFPLILRKRHIPFEEIAQVSIEKINPLRDFGGWGLRYSRQWGKAYTTSGKVVLRLVLRSGKMLNFTADPNTKLTNEI